MNPPVAESPTYRPADLHPVLPIQAGAPAQALHDAAGSRVLEQTAQATLPPHTLMARAGLAVARLALAAWPGARTVQAWAGPGNNGGDALVAARWLHTQGLAVRVSLLADPERLPPDAAWALQQCQQAGVAISFGLPTVGERADLLLDGLLGLGLRRAPEGELAEAIRRLRTEPARVLAIDLPSGLDGDRGVAVGGVAVQAAHTISLLTLKPGLFTAHGRDHAGRVWLDRLGVAPAPTTLWLGGDHAAAARPHASHKGHWGDVLVLGGAPGMAGAAMLAARAALAAGAGRVFMGTLASVEAGFDPLRPELMQRPVATLLDPDRLRSATVVCGCGGGDAVTAWLPAVIHHAGRLVLDADALNAIAADPALRTRLQARGHHGKPTVVTPHPLEAARLLGHDSAGVQADRITSARALAAHLGSVVVLKGSGTVVARPDGGASINPSGNARLASAGTGDVLAGWLGGCWAGTGDSDDALATAAMTACAAVYRHGRAADQTTGTGPLLAADLIAAMQAANPAA